MRQYEEGFMRRGFGFKILCTFLSTPPYIKMSSSAIESLTLFRSALTAAMTEREELPEEIILNIFSRLPVKSLIRFTSVSKRMHFIIHTDPKFAQSQLKAARRQKTQSRRLLVFTDPPELESLPLDADTPSFGAPSSVRKLTLPFLHQQSDHDKFLGSCNGLVFLTLNLDFYYIWNPSTGFFKKLPDPDFSSLDRKVPVYYGVGYLSAGDDYKVLVARCDLRVMAYEVEMFSLRTHIWEKIECGSYSNIGFQFEGTLFNDTLHWLNSYDKHEILCFNLAVKEFRRMWLPDFDNDGESFCKLGVCGGCLCVSRHPEGVFDSIDLWVMREYGVSDSWTMLYSLKVSNPPECLSFARRLLVVGSYTVAVNWSDEGFELMRIDHKADQNVGRYMLKGRYVSIVEYEESLLGISGYHPADEKEQVQILETHHKASKS